MKIKKAELQKALELVKPGLAGKELIEQSTSFAFMGNRVVTYNDEISMSVPLVEGFNLTGAVKAEELYKLLTKLKGDEITLELTENEIQITCGKQRAGLSIQAEIKLPLEELGDIGKFSPLPKTFQESLKFVYPSAGTDMVHPVLTCVHITPDGWMEASDGFRVSRMDVGEDLPIKTNLLIPASMVRNILALGECTISTGKTGWVHFLNKEGTMLSCRIFTDSFPNVAAIMDVKGEELQLPKALTEMLERAKVFGKRDHAMDESVTIDVDGREFTISGENEYGWYEETSPVRYNGEPFTFAVTPQLLQGILDKSNSATIGKDKIRFDGEGWEFIAILRGNPTK